MRFADFLHNSNPFLECQRFVNFAVHFIRTRSSLILSCSSESFLLYYVLLYITTSFYILEWWRESRELWVGGGRRNRGNRSVFNNRENNFPYFIYIVTIISRFIFRLLGFLYLYGFSILSWKVWYNVVVVKQYLSNNIWGPVSILCSDNADDVF